MSLQKRIYTHFGGAEGLAKALKIWPSAISMWKGRIPDARAYQIESLSKGEFTAKSIIAAKKRADKKAIEMMLVAARERAAKKASALEVSDNA